MRRFLQSLLPLSAAGAFALALSCGETSTGGNIIGEDSLRFASSFASYLGGTAEDMIRDAALDPQGNVYLAGGTRSPDFPTTAGVLGPVYHQAGAYLSDAFVTKYDQRGTLLWSTFLGSPEFDRIYGMEVDELGYVYVAGRAGLGFPVTPGSLQTSFAGGTAPTGAYGPQDGFVCKLKPDGTQVVFCTYFGNKDWRVIRDIAIDANHDIYVAAAADATDTLPSLWFANAYQRTVRGGGDALIAKIKGDGSRVEWATFLGGSNEEDNGISLRVDGSGVYLATSTTSPDMPTPNGFSHTLSGPNDVYVAKLSLDGSRLIYGTYVGGSGREGTETHQLAVDGQGNAVITVPSTSADFPTTPSAFQPRLAGPSDILVVKIAPDGKLAAATYVGGSGGDWAEGIAVDAAGNIYISGGTNSADFPVTGGDGPGGGSDLIAIVLSPDLSKLLFSRRLGGSGDDGGRAIAVGGSSFVVGGVSESPNWPVTAAAQATLRGGQDGVVARFAKQP